MTVLCFVPDKKDASFFLWLDMHYTSAGKHYLQKHSFLVRCKVTVSSSVNAVLHHSGREVGGRGVEIPWEKKAIIYIRQNMHGWTFRTGRAMLQVILDSPLVCHAKRNMFYVQWVTWRYSDVNGTHICKEKSHRNIYMKVI